jgi:FkbM family methyltransferase
MLRSPGFNQLIEARHGYMLYNQNDSYIGKAIEKYGEYSGLEFMLLAQLCKPGDSVIEVGANVGAHTLGLAKIVGPTGRVIAFEPQRIAFQTLCANIAINSLTNVDCHWAAVGVDRSVVQVPELDPRKQNNFGGLSLQNSLRGRPVPCVPLDDLNDVGMLRLIKVDVEGMEADVLRGASRLIQEFKPSLYVENDRVETSEELIRLIDSLGYNLYWHTPPLFDPNNHFGNTENIYPNVVSLNMLCLHRDASIQLEGMAQITDFSLHPLRRT